MTVKCSECGGRNNAHNAWCSQNSKWPTPKDQKKQENKRNPVKRKDDGRKRP